MRNKKSKISEHVWTRGIKRNTENKEIAQRGKGERERRKHRK